MTKATATHTPSNATPDAALASLATSAKRVAELAGDKAQRLDAAWDPAQGTPVFTVQGTYTTRGWTEWTQGFQYGQLILAGDILKDDTLIDLGKERTVENMLPHVTHTGVHDHGFNNLSTYGNLLRLCDEGRIPAHGPWQSRYYQQAIAASGAVQASRWAGIPVTHSGPDIAHSDSLGYITSFNGPHSLFVDTMRTTRILTAAWKLGHTLMHENDRRANLLRRAVLHGLATYRYIILHGRAEDRPTQNRSTSGFTPPYADSPYNVRGRTAHEAVFNRTDGAFRCRSTQQGYSPFSTWTRGLAWAMLGYAEHLECFATIDSKTFKTATGLSKTAVVKVYEQAARETCDHYLCDATASDHVPYWDDGAPGLSRLEGWQDRPADPYNDHEPVDASAAAIAAQGLIRLGNYFRDKNQVKKGDAYRTPGLDLAATLFDQPYLSTKPHHQGLLLHSVYHWPNGWDHVPQGQKVPCDESSMWGDYHLLELAALVHRMSQGRYLTFFDGMEP